jgi:hypothetical protein
LAGIRLHHPTLRAGEGTTLTYVVELPQPYADNGKPGARLRSETPCPTCGKPHANKAVHLRLDANGDVIVSPAVYLALQSAFLGGLELVNDVADPPELFLGAVHQDKQRIVEVPLNRDNGHAPLIVPERTKYEGRDRLEAPFRPLVEAALLADDKKQTKLLRLKRRLFT